MPVIEVENIPTVVEPTFAPTMVEATDEVALVEMTENLVQVEFASAATLVPGSGLTGGGYMIGNVPINLSSATITALTNANTALQPGTTAEFIGYLPFGSGLTSTNMQDAVDEVMTIINSLGSGGGSGTLTSIVGTTNQINVNNADPANPVLSLAAPVLASLANIDDFVANPPLRHSPETRIASFSGGSSSIIVPTNNVPINIREDCTITGVILLTEGGVGNCQLDIWKSSLAAYPPTIANSICGSTLPSITAGRTYTDFVLTGWSTALAAGDTLLVKLNSSTVFKIISLFLILTPVNSTPLDGYTDERARDAVGAMLTDTATVNLTHDDALNQIKADVITNALDIFGNTTRGVVPPIGGVPSGKILSDAGWIVLSVDSGVTLPVAATPTFYTGTNVSAVLTAQMTYYHYVLGDYVYVMGTIGADVTTAGINAVVTMDLPIPSDTAGGSGLPLRLIGHGSAVSGTGTALMVPLIVTPNGSADQCNFVWLPTDTTDWMLYFSFMYRKA